MTFLLLLLLLNLPSLFASFLLRNQHKLFDISQSIISIILSTNVILYSVSFDYPCWLLIYIFGIVLQLWIWLRIVRTITDIEFYYNEIWKSSCLRKVEVSILNALCIDMKVSDNALRGKSQFIVPESIKRLSRINNIEIYGLKDSHVIDIENYENDDDSPRIDINLLPKHPLKSSGNINTIAWIFHRLFRSRYLLLLALSIISIVSTVVAKFVFGHSLRFTLQQFSIFDECRLSDAQYLTIFVPFFVIFILFLIISGYASFSLRGIAGWEFCIIYGGTSVMSGIYLWLPYSWNLLWLVPILYVEYVPLIIQCIKPSKHNVSSYHLQRFLLVALDIHNTKDLLEYLHTLFLMPNAAFYVQISQQRYSQVCQVVSGLDKNIHVVISALLQDLQLVGSHW